MEDEEEEAKKGSLPFSCKVANTKRRGVGLEIEGIPPSPGDNNMAISRCFYKSLVSSIPTLIYPS